MALRLRSVFFNNALLKVSSLIIGYALWFPLSESCTIQVTHRVPVCMYNVPSTLTLQAPETVQITLCGKRKDIKALALKDLAVHINGTQLRAGPNPVDVSPTTLFLPDQVKLVSYTPAPSIIQVTVPEPKNVPQPTTTNAPHETTSI
jgi:hypothetical protein